jgi:hypothetical protein
MNMHESDGDNVNRPVHVSSASKKGGRPNKNQYFQGSGDDKSWKGSCTQKSENLVRRIYVELVGSNAITVKMDGFHD